MNSDHSRHQKNDAFGRGSCAPYHIEGILQFLYRCDLVPIYWDNGAADFAVFNRNTGAISDPGVVKALMKGTTPIIASGPVRSSCRPTTLRSLTDALELTIPDPEHVSHITIFDQLGRSVTAINHPAIRKTMRIGANLKPGLYIVQLCDKNGERLQFYKITRN
jgi:hypothetical protein